jgi:dihydrofolate reductase
MAVQPAMMVEQTSRRRMNVRKIINSTYVTLDGVMNPMDWSGQFSSEEHGAYAHELLLSSDALLMGRETYEVFASSWGSRTAADDSPGSDGFVDRINGLAKHVASTTLKEPLEWNNSSLLKGDVAEVVANLKRQPGQNILMYGCGPLARTLAQHDLIDEYRFWVYPVVWGSGKRLFIEGLKATLKHVDRACRIKEDG